MAPPAWLRNAILVSLLIHVLVLLTVRGMQRDALPQEKMIEVELQRDPPPPPPPPPPPSPPVKAVTPPPKPVAPPPPQRTAAPPPPAPVMATAPEAPSRPEQPVVQRAPEPAPPPPPPAPAPAASPPPTPAPAPAPAEPAVDQGELRRGYIRGVSNAVAKQKRYPRLAAQKGWQGEVMVRVVVDGSGHLVEVGIQQGSGYDTLDREAIEMVKRAAPFPLAAGMKKEEITISLPVQFRLESP